MGELRSVPSADVGVLLGVHCFRRGVTQNLPAIGQMGALLQPVAATAQKAPKSFSMLAGGANWPPHQ